MEVTRYQFSRSANSSEERVLAHYGKVSLLLEGQTDFPEELQGTKKGMLYLTQYKIIFHHKDKGSTVLRFPLQLLGDCVLEEEPGSKSQHIRGTLSRLTCPVEKISGSSESDHQSALMSRISFPVSSILEPLVCTWQVLAHGETQDLQKGKTPLQGKCLSVEGSAKQSDKGNNKRESERDGEMRMMPLVLTSVLTQSFLSVSIQGVLAFQFTFQDGASDCLNMIKELAEADMLREATSLQEYPTASIYTYGHPAARRTARAFSTLPLWPPPYPGPPDLPPPYVEVEAASPRGSRGSGKAAGHTAGLA
ncbi:WW domain-binding protein 2 [Varanus komodoensis]|nr:WW domain-binding protein 2 [Varanus komodoensis]